MLNESNIPLEEDGIEEEILVDEEVAITKAMWGDVGGNIENQTDLQNALDAKQDSLTEAQLNAVNSGITAEKVTTYDGYADQIASKADQSALNAESTARGEADTALGTRIDNEVLARQQADNGLQSQIDAITSKSDVVDVVANYAALQAYDTSTLGNNDVVKVLDDETHEDALTYYRWSTTTQTWTYIGQEAPYYSKGQMDVKLAEKQDKLTAGANIQIQNGTISATDTKYTNGNGLNLNGTEFSADTDVLATKEDLEGYYTKPETDNLLAPKLEAEVVAELPTTGAEGKLYLTPKAHTTQTASGNPITVSLDEDEGAIDSFQLDGDTFQQTYTGKNLFNKNNPNMFVGFVGWDGCINSTSACRTIYIPCEPSTTYSIQKPIPTTNPRFRVAVSTDVPANGGTATVLTNDSYMSLGEATVTTRADSAYLMIYIWVDSSDMTLDEVLSGIQIEVGSSVTSFEPFVGGTPSPNPDYPQPIQTVTGEQTISINGTNYPISLGSLELCKLGTYQDYIYKDGDSWKVHKATVSAIIDGSENWDTSGTNTFYVANIYSKIGNSIQSASTGEMYASHFTIVDITSSNTLVGASLRADAAHNVSNLRIRLQDMSGGTAGFRQMLSAKKPSIYARRLTPTDTTITDQTLIAQLEAVLQAKLQASNTITNTATGTNLAGDMEFDYYEYDPTNRYDKWLWLRANNAYEEFDEEGGGGGSITVDSALSTTSKNPVQNKVVTAAINSKVDSSSLATVATSGSYNDLSNKPTIPTIPTQTSAFTNNGSDGTSTYVEADELATVATTGAYSDLSGTPTIPTATGDLTNNSGFITSADLPTKTSDLTNDGSDGTSTYVEASGLATVATSGSYNDLSNKPTIPTVNNGTLTIRQNGETLGRFTANQSTNTTVNLTDNSSYSTSEVKTSATWINGKPIYKKTFSFTLANAESTTVNHGISNFGLLIRFEGAVVQSGTKNVPIPRTLTDTNYQVGLEGVTTTSFEIDVGANGPRGKQAYVTLWYTKTTD